MIDLHNQIQKSTIEIDEEITALANLKSVTPEINALDHNNHMAIDVQCAVLAQRMDLTRLSRSVEEASSNESAREWLMRRATDARDWMMTETGEPKPSEFWLKQNLRDQPDFLERHFRKRPWLRAAFLINLFILAVAVTISETRTSQVSAPTWKLVEIAMFAVVFIYWMYRQSITGVTFVVGYLLCAATLNHYMGWTP